MTLWEIVQVYYQFWLAFGFMVAVSMYLVVGLPKRVGSIGKLISFAIGIVFYSVFWPIVFIVRILR